MTSPTFRWLPASALRPGSLVERQASRDAPPSISRTARPWIVVSVATRHADSGLPLPNEARLLGPDGTLDLCDWVYGRLTRAALPEDED